MSHVSSTVYLSDTQVAAQLGLSRQTIRKWRKSPGIGPPYVKLAKNVRYDSQALQEWLKYRTVA